MSGPLRPPPGAATEEQRALAKKYPALSSFKHITDEVARIGTAKDPNYAPEEEAAIELVRKHRREKSIAAMRERRAAAQAEANATGKIGSFIGTDGTPYLVDPDYSANWTDYSFDWAAEDYSEEDKYVADSIGALPPDYAAVLCGHTPNPCTPVRCERPEPDRACLHVRCPANRCLRQP